MSTLQQYLKRPEPYLIILVLIMLLTLIDVCRKPEDQITGSIYISAVRSYQKYGRPVLKGKVVCRYSPTCSEYSIIAVKENGILKGLEMTYYRIESCRPDK